MNSLQRIARRAAIVSAAALLLVGCRIEPGDTDYESQQIDDFVDDTDSGDAMTFLPGPDPFTQGESRLVFGPFYEGSASEEIPVNDVTNFLFVFQAGEMSSLEITSSTDRVEGFNSDELELTGAPFWGLSISFLDGDPDDQGMPRPENLSDFDTMHVSFKSSDGSFSDIQVGVETLAGNASVDASDYGYTNDGEWHTLAIPLEDFATDMTEVTSPLIVSGEGGTEGHAALIDNFYYSGAQ